MQCKKCGYEPTLAEIQAGTDECPGCIEKARRAQQRAQSAERPVAVRAQQVVVVDFEMSFPAMVRFMVKWAIAAIPALIILALLFMGLASIVSLLGMSGHPPKL